MILVNKKRTKTDIMFQDYFSGITDIRIKVRRMELEFNNSKDDNVGGGSAKNVWNNPVEKSMIREQGDHELRNLLMDKWRVETFYETLSDVEKDILKWHYNKRDYHSWVEIASLLHMDESTCKRRLKKIKIEYKSSMFV